MVPVVDAEISDGNLSISVRDDVDGNPSSYRIIIFND